MASPIWEEGPPASPPYSRLEHEDDVPLSFPSSMLSSSGRNLAGVRRSHTVTAAGSRLHRISSGNSGSAASPGGSYAVHNGAAASSAAAADRPLSASTGVSRRTSINTTSPSLNKVVEGSTSDEDAQVPPEQYPSNAYLPFDGEEDNQAMYINAAASLARHSSMPVRRAFRRDPSNPATPWQRTQHPHNHQHQPVSPPPASASATSSDMAAASPLEQRLRSNSTTAEARLSGASSGQGFSTFSPSSSLYHPTSPNAPISFSNSGFVVTSRPNSHMLGGLSESQHRNAFGHNQQQSSTSMSSAPGHGRSLSSHGWSSPADAHSTQQHRSPAHSRHASDSLSGSTVSQAYPLLGRVPSNASTSSNQARPATESTISNQPSTPSPASPIDSSLLGQNNPWSPTAEERLHFRELSSTMNLATLRQQGLSSGSGSTEGIIESSISPGPISPPSSKRGSALKDTASPRRANSLSTHGRGFKSRAIEEPVPHVPSALSTSDMRQPQRRNTPILPPLVTSPEALFNRASEAASSHAGGLINGPSNEQTIRTQAARTTGVEKSEENHNGQGLNATSETKIIRGPASAAPYVPPIGHTHDSDRKGLYSGGAGLPAGPARQYYDHPNRNADYGDSMPKPVGVEQINHLRGFTTAGPGLPENMYSQERTRIAGSKFAPSTQQHELTSLNQPYQHHQPPQQVQPDAQISAGITSLPPNTTTSLHSAGTMHFPTLNNVNSAANTAALTSSLLLQQPMLAQQTQQLHEQHNQLANALASGLNIHDHRGTKADTSLHRSSHIPGVMPSLTPLSNAQPDSPSNPPNNFQSINDQYAIAAKIEALQKANALLAAAMNNHSGHQHPHLLQQNHHPYHHQLGAPHSLLHGGNTYPLGMYGSITQVSAQHGPASSMDLGQPANGLNGHVQQSGSIGPIDIHALTAIKGYNPQTFDVHPSQARFFVIKSFTEDDVFKSIKFEIWSSTVLGNNRLDKAFSESSEQGPIYLFFSVNASGHFCGVAEMLTPLDYSVTSNVWAQGDKWKGVMKLRWIYIKDIPNPALRHLKLLNTNEQKPVTSSRDTQEVPYEQGCEMLRIFSTYQSKTSLLQDFAYYQAQTAPAPAAAPAAAPAKMNAQTFPLNSVLQPSPSVLTQAGHPGQHHREQDRSNITFQSLQSSNLMHQNGSHKHSQTQRSRQSEPHRR